jgi:diguanylate cyclase (GGDEF)-like protein
MSAYPQPDNEAERQRTLDSFQILDSDPDEDFDRITRIASQMLGMPIALISLVDHDRQWFLSRVGLQPTETAREVAFCAHTICSNQVMVVGDARDDSRFQDNPLVTGEPHIRFYAGAPLRTREGHALGTLCVIGSEPRRLEDNERRLLEELAGMVIHTLESRRDRYLCPLTGLQNRRPFFEAGQREFQRSLLSGEPLTLALIALDDFGPLSERFASGHGDRVLQEVSRMLRSELGSTDVAARVAGAEFAALLCGQKLEVGVALVEGIRSRFAQQGVIVDGTRHALSISAGVASRGPQDTGFSDLYQRAEASQRQAWISGGIGQS